MKVVRVMSKKVVPEQDCGLSGHKKNAFLVGHGSRKSVSQSGGEREGASGRQETIPFVAAAGAAYGHIAGLILCLIRYRCNVPGPDRIETEDGRLWRVSYASIASALGMSRQQVQRAVPKLEEAGAVVVEYRPEQYGDQRRSFRVVPDPSIWLDDPDSLNCESSESNRSDNSTTCESSESVSERVRNRTRTSSESVSERVRNRTGTSSESNSLPLSEEVEEGGKEEAGSGRTRASRDVAGLDPLLEANEERAGASDADASIAPGERPAERCQRHDGLGWVEERCGDCARAKADAKRWDAGEDERRAAAVRTKRRAVEECGRCDELGWVDLGDSVAKCTHPEVVAA
ncbi:hypothetical protein HBA53_13225 [Rhodococcus pyridinivorans]|uniref:hypothetical protein n=1 Tax=Rhodococcus pyridinivorans TaxID=103816 RepID=UPI001C309274|nr:hypothetical protein [Rhodococcus pyridinivorans]QXF81897.1 hypothetical protein HBA53_13225 [Rhodococcus pyridinivorans]